MNPPVTLRRDCRAIRIPGGETAVLPAGTPVVLAQARGGSYTVEAPTFGGLFRVAGVDADALGLAPADASGPASHASDSPVEEEDVWDRLRTCYDPEIPVNIVDLGLVYDMRLLPHPSGGRRVEVRMTLTAPGCGMGPAIAADAQQKLASLPGVAEAEVKLVWDPPWSLDMMSPGAKRLLGVG